MVDLLLDFENRAVWVSSHLKIEDMDCDECYPQRHNNILRFARDLLSYDPIASYISLLKEVENTKTRANEQSGRDCEKCFKANLKHLLSLKEQYDKTEFVKTLKPILTKIKDYNDLTDVYKTVFEAQVKPAFIGSQLRSDAEKFELIDEYQVLTTNVQIFKHPEKIELIYNINPARIYFVTRPLFCFVKNKRHC